MAKKEYKPTEKQKANLFVKGDPRIEEGLRRSEEARKQRKKWREAKQFAAARKKERFVLSGENVLMLTGYDTERDLLRAENDMNVLLQRLARCSLYELAEILSEYKKD